MTEMISADPKFQNTVRNALRLDLTDVSGAKIVQIAGGSAKLLADAAKMAVDYGAEVVDINMGCPAKKVCKQQAGSALMKDERLVATLLDAVVNAVEVPVTVKMRTGWDRQNKNAVSIAILAEKIGISVLTVHGRTRACKFNGVAEYDTIKMVKAAVSIPVVANGDIACATQAEHIFKHTNCDGLMVGRAAVGDPWIFPRLKTYLKDKRIRAFSPSPDEVLKTAYEHLFNMHRHYGDQAIKIARKHIVAYLSKIPNGAALTNEFNQQTTRQAQLEYLSNFNNDNNNAGVLAA